jgi:hypothetical protein
MSGSHGQAAPRGKQHYAGDDQSPQRGGIGVGAAACVLNETTMMQLM